MCATGPPKLVSPSRNATHSTSSGDPCGTPAMLAAPAILPAESYMAFTVEDFRGLMRLLEQHPEWREELRRQVLTEELLALPEIVRDLAAAQTRTEARLDQLAERVDQLAERLDQLAGRVDQLAGRIDELAQAQARTEQALTQLAERVDALVGRVGAAWGKLLELDVARKGPAYFGQWIRRSRVLDPGDLVELLDDAVDAGQISMVERDQAILADVVLTGPRHQDGAVVRYVAEISGGVGTNDVKRAAERAAIVAKLGITTIPVVVGEHISRNAQAAAEAAGVEFLRVEPTNY
jgi:hypothetical protein